MIGIEGSGEAEGGKTKKLLTPCNPQTPLSPPPPECFRTAASLTSSGFSGVGRKGGGGVRALAAGTRGRPAARHKRDILYSAAGTDVTLRPSAGGGRLGRWRETVLATDCPSNAIFWMGDVKPTAPRHKREKVGAPPLCRAQQSFPEVGLVQAGWRGRVGGAVFTSSLNRRCAPSLAKG